MSMDKSAADAYVYSKASGMLAKSFIGSRAVQLYNVHTLQELWSLLFTKNVPVVPETLLAKALETEARNKFIADYKTLLGNYAEPSPVLISLLHFYDYENVKDIGASLFFKEPSLPDVVDISPYNFIQYKKWPNIAAMTAKSPLSWYNTVPLLSEQQKNDYKIDSQYIEEIWESVHKIHSACRAAVINLFTQKIRIDNVLWALRLRIYYNMEKEEIIENLAYATDTRRTSSPLVHEAVKVLDWAVDDYSQWKNWKYASLLNPHEEGVIWNIDPRWIYNVHRKQYVQKALRLFHQYPFTECPLLCWYIIKQNELDNIRTASESLRLHIQVSEVAHV